MCTLVGPGWELLYGLSLSGSLSPEQRGTNEPALDVALDLLGDEKAAEFSPFRLKECRSSMIERRRVNCRKINGRVSIIRQAFRWATSEGLSPALVLVGLDSVTNLLPVECGACSHTIHLPLFVLRTCAAHLSNRAMPTKKPSKNLARRIGVVLIAAAGYLSFRPRRTPVPGGPGRSDPSDTRRFRPRIAGASLLRAPRLVRHPE